MNQLVCLKQQASATPQYPSDFTMSSIFNSGDTKLIQKFAQGSNQLLSNDRVRLETSAGVSQVIAQNGEILAIMYLQRQPRTALIKAGSAYAEKLSEHLIDRDFVLLGDAKLSGFLEYRHYVTPAGYRVNYTEPAILWKKWWPTERFQNKQRFNMNILVRLNDNWYPIQTIVVEAGRFTIKTLPGQIDIKSNEQILWLYQMPAAGKSEDNTAANIKGDEGTDAWDKAADVSNIRPASSEMMPPLQPKAPPKAPDLETRLQQQQRATIAAEERAMEAEQQLALAEQKIAALQRRIQILAAAAETPSEMLRSGAR
jgi:hypothetical protein